MKIKLGNEEWLLSTTPKVLTPKERENIRVLTETFTDDPKRTMILDLLTTVRAIESDRDKWHRLWKRAVNAEHQAVKRGNELKRLLEENTPHEVIDARCPYCAHRWVAVAPVNHAPLECPRCHLQAEEDA